MSILWVESAAFPYTLGLACALLALVALSARRLVPFSACVLLTFAASPLAFVLLAVVLAGVAASRSSRDMLRPGAVVLATAVVGALLWRAFPDRGLFPYSSPQLAASLAFCAVGLLFTWRVERARVLRFFFGIYAVACLTAFAIPSGLGENVGRFRFVAIPIAVLALSLRSWRPVVPAVVALALATSWNLTPLAYSFVRGSSDPSSQAAYWQPVVRYLHRELPPSYRVEAVDTTGHWPAVYLARAGVPIVRGWFRQDDFPQNQILYKPLSAPAYVSWLRRMGVAYVVLTDAPADYSSKTEAASAPQWLVRAHDGPADAARHRLRGPASRLDADRARPPPSARAAVGERDRRAEPARSVPPRASLLAVLDEPGGVHRAAGRRDGRARGPPKRRRPPPLLGHGFPGGGGAGRPAAALRLIRRSVLVAAPALVVAGGAGVALLVFRRDDPTPVAKHAAPIVAKAKHRSVPLHLSAQSAGSLAAPIQDAAGAALQHGSVLLLGGLTAGDVSTNAMRVVSAGRDRALGRLPVALHDAAAARLGRFVYLFGGGDGSAQHREIVRVDPVSGRTQQAGSLPDGSSDQAAAAIGGTAYVVGGFDGSRWLDTVVAWRPGGSARIVAHLPDPVRYAAVTAVGRALVVAGGSLPDGRASDSVYVLRAGSSRAVRIGRLPRPTTHASAAAIGGEAVIVGGRGASTGTPTARLVAIDVGRRTIRAAGSLGAPLSDATAVTIGRRILVAGGRTVRGTVAGLRWLAPGRQVAHARTSLTANVYAADGANMLSGAAALALPRIYVPNSESNTVDVIDPATRRVVDHFAVGVLPQHVTPSYDLKTLYVLNDVGNTITPIDPQTAKPGTPIPVDDPYNMYFTPDGRYAIVVAERLHRLDFRDPHTFKLHHSLPVPCSGVDHMDFSADGTYLIASCEFSGELLKVDVAGERVVKVLHLRPGGMPQDVKLSPDGRVFYVADMRANGLWEIDGDRLKTIGFLPTGRGVHGLYPSRDARYLYATNRGEGSISVISFRTRKVVKTWRIPGGGSPDMGGVSADGKTLWLSGRYNAEVYALSTRTGSLLARIPVGRGPHGLCVWPQPGATRWGTRGSSAREGLRIGSGAVRRQPDPERDLHLRRVAVAGVVRGLGGAGAGDARAGAVRLHRGRRRLRGDDAGEPRGVRAPPAAPEDADGERDARPFGGRARHEVARAVLPRAGGRPLDRARRGRACGGARGRGARDPARPVECGVPFDGGGRRGARRHTALVPALLGQRSRCSGKPRRPRRCRRVLRDRRHGGHALARLAAARPRARLPAVPPGRGDRPVHERSRLPRAPRRFRPRRTCSSPPGRCWRCSRT